jgi:hypothetical protein
MAENPVNFAPALRTYVYHSFFLLLIMRMIKSCISTHTQLLLLPLLFLVFQDTVAASKDDILWKSGFHFVVKYDKQDSAKLGKNDHPVELNDSTISNALDALRYEDKSLLTGQVEILPVFTANQVEILSKQLAKGLREASPEHDIIFVLGNSGRKLLVLKDNTFLAGRAFYKDDRLNIILGDFDRSRNEAFEAVYDPSGNERIPYTFNYGYRTKTNTGFKKDVVNVPGVLTKVIGNDVRQNWFVIDVNEAAAATIARKKREEQGITGNTEAMQREAEKLAQERRQLRLEMAKMRKEMEEGGAVSSGGLSIEERLLRLEQLKEKGLITEDEYQAKRREVLEDI